MFHDIENVLVLAPHTDDGELGLGGTINKLILAGNKVTYVAFSTAEESVPTLQLGIKPDDLIIFNYQVRKLNYVRQEILEELINIRKNKKYDLVFIPSLHDIHQDHSTIAQEGLRAFKNTTILGYELIWNNLSFDTQCFVRLSQENIDVKIRALKEYHSQGKRNYLSEEFVYSLARARGVQVGCEFAEAFEVVRLFL